MVFIKVGDDESVAVFTGENLITAKTPYSTDDTSKHSVSMEKLDELKEAGFVVFNGEIDELRNYFV